MTDGKGRVSILALGAAAMLVFAVPAAAQQGGAGQQAGAAQGAAAAGTRGAALFQRLDADGDGAISLDEFTARARARFAELDVDGDGLISAEEAQNLGPAPRRAEMSGPRGRGDRDWRGNGRKGGYHYGAGPGMQGGGYGMFGGMDGSGPMGYGGFGDPRLTDEERADRARSLVEMLDADGDGMLSAEELAARPGPQMIFDRIDTDGDGVISKEEFDAAAERFGDRVGARRATR
ncbi:EF-hand domain-containing protein [Rhodovulum tesquicola]|uniref:EF-hand domain-containing protein n=1 Tax=Rhodovulum tesquicola TaxID=540254 RepID=UPI002096A0DF|nr:EF-hand domain-containing protein [Rhodovulum tesquicola]MCO8146257.1 EF-hand domain-containing protein [Rhodovulum tesquicola]